MHTHYLPPSFSLPPISCTHALYLTCLVQWQTNFWCIIDAHLFIYYILILWRRQRVHLGSVPLKCLQIESISLEFCCFVCKSAQFQSKIFAFRYAIPPLIWQICLERISFICTFIHLFAIQFVYPLACIPYPISSCVYTFAQKLFSHPNQYSNLI